MARRLSRIDKNREQEKRRQDRIDRETKIFNMISSILNLISIILNLIFLNK